MNNSSKQIKLGAIISYIAIAVNILAGLIYTPWMINQIGKSDYGLFTLANSLITLFLLDFGLSSATARFVAKYRAENNQDKVNNFLGMVYKLYLVLDILIFFALTIVLVFMDKIYVKLTIQEIEKLKVVFVIAGIYSLVNFPFITLNGILTAYEKFVQQKLADLLYRILVISLMIIALSTGHGLFALVIVNAISGLIIITYKIVVIKVTTQVKVNIRYYNKGLLREIFGFSIWVTISTLAQRLIFNITPTILGIVASSSAIAVFGIITTVEGYVYTITTAINGLFMPKISRIYVNNAEKQQLFPLMLNVGRFQFALNMVIVLGFGMIGKQFIIQWMGKDYIMAYYGILLVIIPGLIFNSLQIANTTMIVANMVKKQAMVMLISGIANVILSFIFSYKFGVIGACLSIFLVYIFRAIAYIVITHKNLKVNMWKFIKECYIKMSIPAIITFLICEVIFRIWYFNGWIEIITKGIIVAVTYALITYLFIRKSKRI